MESGSGTATRNALTSPLGKAVVWILKYVMSLSRPAANAASAPATVPPFAVMNAGLKLEANVKSKALTKVPEVTPSGNPTKLGVVVATPVFPGGAIQQWICAAVVF